MTAPKVYPPAEMLAKMQKLADMSVGVANEHEAALAGVKVMELLQRYDMSLADLSAIKREEQNPMTVCVVRILNRYGKMTNRSYPWLRTLAYRVGRACLCETLTGKCTVTFIGAKHDTETAEYILLYLRQQLETLAREATKRFTDGKSEELDIDNKNYLPGANHPNVYRESFLDGCVVTVTQQFATQEEKFNDASKKSALVIVNSRERAKQFAQEKFKLTYFTAKGKERKGGNWSGPDGRTNWDAYAEGKEAGKTVKVKKAIKSGDAGKALSSGAE